MLTVGEAVEVLRISRTTAYKLTAAAYDDLEDPSDEGVVLVASNDERTLPDAVGLGCLVKEAEDIARLVDLLLVSGQCHDDLRLAHGVNRAR